MKNRLLYSVSLCFFVSACQTTGDPRSGGLFGWSEEEAKQRQINLQSHADSTEQQAEKERALTEKYHLQKQASETEVRALESRLKGLRAENKRLEDELSELLKTKDIKSEELKLLVAELESQPDVQVSIPADSARQHTYARQLDERNRKLHQVILLLLQN